MIIYLKLSTLYIYKQRIPGRFQGDQAEVPKQRASCTLKWKENQNQIYDKYMK